MGDLTGKLDVDECAPCGDLLAGASLCSLPLPAPKVRITSTILRGHAYLERIQHAYRGLGSWSRCTRVQSGTTQDSTKGCEGHIFPTGEAGKGSVLVLVLHAHQSVKEHKKTRVAPRKMEIGPIRNQNF